MESEREELAFDVYDGEDDNNMMEPLCPVVIFHGLLDHKENWADIAKEIAEKTVRKVYVLDMRDHGDSPKTSSMNHENNVCDLEQFIQKLKKPPVLIGHSLGGTAIMDLAFHKPNLVKEIVLVDVSPLTYPLNAEISGLTATNILKQVLQQLPTDINLTQAKTILKNKMKNVIQSSSVNKLMCSNLDKRDTGWKCKFNFESIEKMGTSKAMRNVYPLRGIFEGRCLLVHSDTSGYIIPKDDYKLLKIRFPKIQILCFENCSHWIHLDMPRELTHSIVQFLNKNNVMDK
ncbi:protein ABHD11-like [Centruroides sculpturatus]|uniref:protein ABHD11-like n=1 Tax=Centruroides sculpturatus TaxID=218467 RepID=UPI000C6EC6FC|nr:protein ABHD11-like [Centruroides sculpturatus]